MNRRQQRLQLVLLPLSLFIPVDQNDTTRLESLEAVGDTAHPLIIYQQSSDIWINVCAYLEYVDLHHTRISDIRESCNFFLCVFFVGPWYLLPIQSKQWRRDHIYYCKRVQNRFLPPIQGHHAVRSWRLQLDRRLHTLWRYRCGKSTYRSNSQMLHDFLC